MPSRAWALSSQGLLLYTLSSTIYTIVDRTQGSIGRVEGLFPVSGSSTCDDSYAVSELVRCFWKSDSSEIKFPKRCPWPWGIYFGTSHCYLEHDQHVLNPNRTRTWETISERRAAEARVRLYRPKQSASIPKGRDCVLGTISLLAGFVLGFYHSSNCLTLNLGLFQCWFGVCLGAFRYALGRVNALIYSWP